MALGVLIGSVPVAIRYLPAWSIEAFWAVVLGPLVVGCIGSVILLVMRQWLSAIGFFAAAGLASLVALCTPSIRTWR